MNQNEPSKINLLIDLFDYSGNAADPYRKTAIIEQVDIKRGTDILLWKYQEVLRRHDIGFRNHGIEMVIGILAAIPCTDYATSGSKHFAKKDANGETAKSQLLVAKTKEIIDFCSKMYKVKFWKIENPRTRIHSLNPWIGKITQKFNPCDFACYNTITPSILERFEYLATQDMRDVSKIDLQLVLDINAYNKETWLFGKFNKLRVDAIKPVWKENPGWRLYGGKSDRTKELRSIDPIGYCKAFYEANN